MASLYLHPSRVDGIQTAIESDRIIHMRRKCSSNIQNGNQESSHALFANNIQLPSDVKISSANIAVNKESQIDWVHVVLKVLTIDVGQIMVSFVIHLK